ncbi:hypothetical protein [Rubritalea marina]|uniref:hypothetical protein n=1 Tax=Rubritalea marina TaxID=361055 RepID=UPI0012EA278D|nr:hypothetical protein [Rubritalea marina]
MQRKIKFLCLGALLAGLSSCNAPVVKKTLALPGNVVRGTAHATGFGGVAGM